LIKKTPVVLQHSGHKMEMKDPSGPAALAPPPPPPPPDMEPFGLPSKQEAEEANRKRKAEEKGAQPAVGQRSHYTGHFKRQTCKWVTATGLSISACHVQLRKRPLWASIAKNTLLKWMSEYKVLQVGGQLPKRRQPGPGRDAAFDECVFRRLVVTDDDNKVVGNSVYCQEQIRAAAAAARAGKDPSWFGPVDGPPTVQQHKSREYVGKLVFSNSWIMNWLAAVSLSRRRVTATSAKLPSLADVQENLKMIREYALENGIDEDMIFSCDETGMFWAFGARFKYVDAGADRAVDDGASDDKLRFTVMIGGSCALWLPLFIIVKCSTPVADQSKTTVLKTLKEKLEDSDDWERRVWSKTLNVAVKGKKGRHDIEFKRQYLYNTKTGAVIMSQSRAWMDTAGIVMWLELVVAPFARKVGKKLLVVWDNCGSHCAPAIKDLLKSEALKGVHIVLLIANATGVIQVMDINVNRSFKAWQQRHRIKMISNYFQSFRLAYYRAKAEMKPLPPYKPPMIELHEAIKMALQWIPEVGETSDFQAGMRSTFERLGLVHHHSFQGYARFQYDTCQPTVFDPLKKIDLLAELQIDVEQNEEEDVELDDADLAQLPAELVGLDSPPAAALEIEMSSDDDVNADEMENGLAALAAEIAASVGVRPSKRVPMPSERRRAADAGEC
jgi:hypothetical protein